MQLREIYAEMWSNLGSSKQETMIKTAVSRIDKFSDVFFEIAKYNNYEEELNKKSSLEPSERILKLLLSFTNSKILDIADFKKKCIDRIIKVKTSMGNSNFIWSAISCNIVDAFTIEHFFMNLIIQELEMLYFKTIVINEIEVEHTDRKRKNKKKNKKKKAKDNDNCQKEEYPELKHGSDLKISQNNQVSSLKYKANETDNHYRVYKHDNSHFKPNESYYQEKQYRIDYTIPLLSIEDKYKEDLYFKNDSPEDHQLWNGNYTPLDINAKSRKESFIDEILSHNDRVNPNRYPENEIMNKNNERMLAQTNSISGPRSELDSLCQIAADETKRYENNTSKANGIDHSIIGGDLCPDVDIKHNFNRNTGTEHEPNTLEYHGSQANESVNDKFITNQDLPSELMPHETLRINQSKISGYERGQSIGKKESKMSENNSKLPDNDLRTKEDVISCEYKHAPDEGHESLNNNIEDDIETMNPISRDHDNRNKAKSANEHNNTNIYYNYNGLSNKEANSNIVLNDLNKIDAKPKRPKLKKVNKNIKKDGRDKEEQGLVSKADRKLPKLRRNDKPKISNQEPAKEEKLEIQTKKQETNASIKAITYWCDEPQSNKTAVANKNRHEPNKTPNNPNKESDAYLTDKNKNNASGDKFKLKKKGSALKGPSKFQLKDYPNISSPIQTTKKSTKGDTPIIEKHKLNDSIDTAIENSSNEISETQVVEQVKSQFNKVMDDSTNEIMAELESYTQKLDIGRKIVQERINTIVQKTFNNNSVYVQEYGSYATRLLTPYSDMDLSIQGCLMLDKEQAIEMLQVLSDNLKLFGFVKHTMSILTAIVPVIKIEADPSVEFEESGTISEPMRIKVDIIVDLMDVFNPISTPMRTTDYIRYCITTYPSFYKNVLFLKFALNCNDFTNAYKGGLNAYGLCILYVAYIEFYNLEKSIEHFKLLRGFLKFLASQFNPEAQAVYFGTAFR